VWRNVCLSNSYAQTAATETRQAFPSFLRDAPESDKERASKGKGEGQEMRMVPRMHGSPLPDISRPSGFLSHKQELPATNSESCCAKTREVGAPCPIGRKCPHDIAPVAELVTEAEEYVRASDPLMAGMGDGKSEPWVPERFVERPTTRMTPKDMALRAADLISGGRAHVHGDFRKNHANIAASWSWYLQARFAGAHVIQLTAHDAALMLELFKIARTLTGAHNPDDYVDAIGYAAIAGGIAEQDAEIGDKIEAAERAK